jgi:hypothetical protein
VNAPSSPLLQLPKWSSSAVLGPSTGYKLGNLAVILLLPAFLWLGALFSRPRKEERFLFPIYLLLVIGVGEAVFLDQAMDAVRSHKTIAVGKYIHKDVAAIVLLFHVLFYQFLAQWH